MVRSPREFITGAFGIILASRLTIESYHLTTKWSIRMAKSRAEIVRALKKAWTGETSSSLGAIAILPSLLNTGSFQRVAVLGDGNGHTSNFITAIKCRGIESSTGEVVFSLGIEVHDSYGNIGTRIVVVGPRGLLKLGANLPLVGFAKYWQVHEDLEMCGGLEYNDAGKGVDGKCAVEDVSAAKSFIESFAVVVSDYLIEHHCQIEVATQQAANWLIKRSEESRRLNVSLLLDRDFLRGLLNG